MYRVKNAGVRCATWPCPEFKKEKINSSIRRDIAEVDLSDLGDDAVAAAEEAMTTAQSPR